MHNLFLSCLLLFCSFSVFAQDAEIKAYVAEGIELHDAGEYQAAVKVYEKGLALDKKSPLLHYEIAFSYLAMKNTDKAIFHAKKAAKNKSKHQAEAMMMLGNIYDQTGKTDKAVEIYAEATEKYPEFALLHFNYGIALYNQGRYGDAEQAFTESASLDYSHASSHYYLGILADITGQKTKSLLALSFFLLLENEGERAVNAVQKLQNFSSTKIEQKGENTMEININLVADDNEFTATDLLLSLQSAKELADEGESEKLTMQEKLIRQTDEVLHFLAESKEKKSGLYHDLYLDLFEEIRTEGHLETFIYYITMSNEASLKWLEEHPEETEKFGAFFEE